MDIGPKTRQTIMRDFINEFITDEPIARYFKGIGFYVADSSKMAQLRIDSNTPVSQEELRLEIKLRDDVPPKLSLLDKYFHSTGQYPIRTSTTEIFDLI